MLENKIFWEQVYRNKNADEVSWFQEIPSASLRIIDALRLGQTQKIIDVGGGASTLVDHLLVRGFLDISVLDISSSALDVARKRLGQLAHAVRWIESDITVFAPEQKYTLWHDRAVLHFLTTPHERACYLSTLHKSLAPGAQVVIATFALDGPKRCSGINVVQYDEHSLSKLLGNSFILAQAEEEVHFTPKSAEQKFLYCRFQYLP